MGEGARVRERKSLLRSPLTPSPSFFSRFDLGSAFERLYLSHFTNLKRKHTEKKLPATQATTDMTLNCESKRTHSADSPRERGEGGGVAILK